MRSSVFKGGVSLPPPLFADDGLNDNAIIGMWYWDVLNDRLYADARMAALFGVDPLEAMRGTRCDAFVVGIHPDDRNGVAQEIERCVRAAIDFRCEYRIITAAGERLISAFARCHRTEGRSAGHYVGMAYDVTRQRDAEAITPTSRVADHVMQAYSLSSQITDDEIRRKLKDVLVQLGMNLAAEIKERPI
ncbi:PAS domain-containing protein [uncultured Bosea sp.]|uniref:PAS domain-containing protein n=1 Tax=uncultured Bosea sp. TaxID=211457 RepID=UPI0025F607B9|nr:PAS domain-containing protein [uncultured Bosea sp.]